MVNNDCFQFLRHSVGFDASFESFNLLKDDVYKQKFEQYSMWIKFFLFKITGVSNFFVPWATSRPSGFQRAITIAAEPEIKHFAVDVMAMTKKKSLRLKLKRSESTSQFRWFTIAKIEL